MAKELIDLNKTINLGFWQKLPKPVFCLAPMEEVTDVVFREMFARYSGGREKNVLRPNGEDIFSDENKNIRFSTRACPEPAEGSNINILNNFVMFTEFINVDGILHPTGFERLKIDLEYTENQRPIVVQIWGTDPEKFFKAAQLMVKMGFDGIDINMGCPQDKEIGIGACAALIRNPKLASQIIEATIKGARLQSPSAPANGGQAGSLPVSVKTRTGYSKPETEAWIAHLLKHGLAAITLHARTKLEKSKVPAQWEEVKKAVDVRNAMQSQTLIIGNGDVKNREEGLKRIEETGCDGVMIARGAFGHPWIFRTIERENPKEGFSLSTSQTSSGTALPFQSFNSPEVNSTAIKSTKSYQPSAKERLMVMLEHARLFDAKLGKEKSFVIMRKHFKSYLSGFDGAAELRAKLLETKNLQETEGILAEFLKSFS